MSGATSLRVVPALFPTFLVVYLSRFVGIPGTWLAATASHTRVPDSSRFPFPVPHFPLSRSRSRSPLSHSPLSRPFFVVIAAFIPIRSVPVPFRLHARLHHLRHLRRLRQQFDGNQTRSHLRRNPRALISLACSFPLLFVPFHFALSSFRHFVRSFACCPVPPLPCTFVQV